MTQEDNSAEIKVPVFWTDDERASIEDVAGKLHSMGFDVKIFDKPQRTQGFIVKHMKSVDEAFAVGVADLNFENVQNQDGIDFVSMVTGFYRNKFGIAARIGVVTSYMKDYKQRLSVVPHAFSYSKSELQSEGFLKFAHNVKWNADMFQIDKAAIKYMESHPPDFRNSQFKLIHALFGYIDRVEGDFAWICMWDPAVLFSETIRRYERDFLAKRKIIEVGQPIRICTFEHEKTKGIFQIIERIGNLSGSRIPLRKDYDYRRFRNLSETVIE